MSEATQQETEKVQTYFVHNTSRSRFNRTQRAAAPEHGGHKQYIGGEHRLVRGRPVSLTPEMFDRHLEELKAKEKVGLITVTSPDGRPIDLETKTFKTAAPVVPPLPNKPLDSIQNDKPAGNFVPQMAGGLPEMTAPEDGPAKLPDLVATAPSETEDDDAGAGASASKATTQQQAHQHQQRSGKNKGRR